MDGFKELFKDYSNEIMSGDGVEERDFDGLKIMRQVISDEFCHLCSLG